MRALRVARTTSTVVVGAAFVVVGGCGGDKVKSADSVAAAQAPAAAVAGAAPAPACPRTGHWLACAVRYRIDRAGLAPHDSSANEGLPALGPKPLVYRVGKAGLAVYLFTDSLARARAARLLDTTRFIPYAHELTVRSEATVIENDNLLALLFSKNDHQRERVSDALTAGPPQP